MKVKKLANPPKTTWCPDFNICWVLCKSDTEGKTPFPVKKIKCLF